MHSILNDFSIVMKIPVAWGDMDAFEHVNNTVYLKYFETLRIQYFQEVGYLEMMKNDQIGPILRDTYCRFRIPVTYPDTIIGGIRTNKIASDRFWMKFTLVSEQHNQIAAEGEGTIVSFNYQINQKALLQPILIQRIHSLEKIVPELSPEV